MGSLFNKVKETSTNSNNNILEGRQYKDEDKVELSGIQYTTGVVITDESDNDINILAESFKDVAFPLHYENKIFKLSKNAKLEIALSHQLRLETYMAITEWGESDEATGEVTLLTIDPQKYPTAGDYYEDPSIRAVFVKLAAKEGADVTEEVVSRGKALFSRAKR